MTHKDAETTRRHFPNIYERCLACGIDMTRQPIPVVPAAHYMCGGVVTDEQGRTDIDRLYASGEVACTGLHGANRLASNSLLEALVFSDRVLRSASERVSAERGLRFPDVPDWTGEAPSDPETWNLLARDREEVRRLMWECAGIIRSDFRLRYAERRIAGIVQDVEEFYARSRMRPDLIEFRNLATVALLIVRSALMRRESRGLHYNTDCPDRDDTHWRKDTLLNRYSAPLPLPTPDFYPLNAVVRRPSRPANRLR